MHVQRQIPYMLGTFTHHFTPAGAASSEELSEIHLDSDACLLAVEDPARPQAAEGTAGANKGAGSAVILAFRCACSLRHGHDVRVVHSFSTGRGPDTHTRKQVCMLLQWCCWCSGCI